ncbi:MAG: TonB-dependent receptor [Gemmatimonadota bacterium]
MLAVTVPTATAQQRDTSALLLDSLIATGERSYSAASSATVRALDIRLRPHASSQELLQLAPGVVIAQQGGGGKAEQIFMRGLDADHGTDVAISVDGVPVNVVSHAHGQGYADLHFLMPELVERIDVRKGPFDARDGDFATAGAIDFKTVDSITAPASSIRAGSFGTWNLWTAVPLHKSERASSYIAAGAHRSRGFFDAPQNHSRYNAFGKWTWSHAAASYALTTSYYAADWRMSGQIPERAVRAGMIGRFGSIDPSEGGATRRAEVRALAAGTTSTGSWSAHAYAIRSDFNLFSNFTFLARDSVNGDGIEQQDSRYTTGVALENALLHRIGNSDGIIKAGIGGRFDAAKVGLFHQHQRARLGAVSDEQIRQAHAYAWLQEEAQLSRNARIKAGVRTDAFRFETSVGARTIAIVNPKLSFAYDVGDRTSLFASLGTGFHSNDARDAAAAAGSEAVVPRARSAEAGMRHTRARATFAAAAWLLDLGSELVYVGDEGVTEPSGRTRRLGVDAEARIQLLRWLWADVDVNLARGRFLEQPALVIPLAPSFTSAGGLTVRDAGPVSGGMRYRLIGDRAADEERRITANGHTQLQAFAAWTYGRTRLQLAVDNLLDSRWNEAQFATTSRLAGERMPVTELHFTPGTPRAIQLDLQYHF